MTGVEGAAVQRARRQASRKRTGGQDEEENRKDKCMIADEEVKTIYMRHNPSKTFLSRRGGGEGAEVRGAELSPIF